MQRTILLTIALSLLSGAAIAQSQDPDLSGIRAYYAVDDQLSTSGQITAEETSALKKAGFEVVVNLAPADETRNGQEGFWVVKEGMTYVQIPVEWRDPQPRDLELFFAIMEANRGRKTLVHCFANMRASAFVYLYRTLRQDVAQRKAATALNAIWDPFSDERHETWAQFIKAAESAHGRGRN